MPNPYPVLIRPSSTVVASPAAAAETTVAQITVGSVAGATSTLFLLGFLAFTVGATGTAVRVRIRNGSITGTVVGDTGALTGGVAAAALMALSVMGVDTPGDVSSLLYVMTLQVTGGSGASAVTSVQLAGIVFG